MFAYVYLALWLLAPITGLMLEAAGVSAGGWIALVGLVALIPAVYPMPEREDIPWVLALVAVLIPAFLLLKVLGAPSWSYTGAGVVAVVLVVANQFRREARASGSIRIPPGYRFGGKRKS